MGRKPAVWNYFYCVYDKQDFPVAILENLQELMDFFGYTNKNNTFAVLSKHLHRPEDYKYMLDREKRKYKLVKVRKYKYEQ